MKSLLKKTSWLLLILWCVGTLTAQAGKLKAFDALRVAEEAGSSKAVNVVLLGAASKDLPFSNDAWIKVIEDNVKPKFVEMNKFAFTQGQLA